MLPFLGAGFTDGIIAPGVPNARVIGDRRHVLDRCIWRQRRVQFWVCTQCRGGAKMKPNDWSLGFFMAVSLVIGHTREPFLIGMWAVFVL